LSAEDSRIEIAGGKATRELVDGGEVILRAVGVGDHCLGVGLGVPVGGADFSVLVGVLEGFDQSTGGEVSRQSTFFTFNSHLKVSSTDLPTGKSFTVIWRKFCFPSMMNKPRKEMPDSSCKTP
jgi:hypothetical protein